MQAGGALAFVQQINIGRLGLFVTEGAPRQDHQGVPRRGGGQGKRQLGQCHATQQLQPCGVGNAHHIGLVHHQHPVGQVLDDQCTDLRLHARRDLALLRHFLFARQAGGQLVHQIAHDEVACAGQRTLQVALALVARAVLAHPPRPAQQQQRDCGGGAQGQGQRAHDRCDQDGQAEQGRVVHGARMQQLQRSDRRQVHTNGGQPLRAGAGRRRGFARQHPQHHSGHQVGHADCEHGRRRRLIDQLPGSLQHQKRQGHHHAARQKTEPQPCEGGVCGRRLWACGRCLHGHNGKASLRPGPCAGARRCNRPGCPASGLRPAGYARRSARRPACPAAGQAV